MPSSLTTTPVPSQWPGTSQDMAPGAPSYGVETYVDNWMSYFERPNDVFQPGGHDFPPNFVPPDTTGFPLGSSPQFYPTATSAATMPQMQSIPLDPNLVDGPRSYDSQSTQPGAASQAFRPDVLAYDEDEIRSSIAEMDPRMMTTLENFARLSSRKQQQILELIRKKRSQPERPTIDDSMDIRFMGYHHVMPVPSGKATHSYYLSKSRTVHGLKDWRLIFTLRTGFTQ